MPVRLVIATTNSDKLKEIRALLVDVRMDLLGLADLPPVPDPEETGDTFQDNARLKALYYGAHVDRSLQKPGSLVVAEDSGLIVDALEGDPGVRSARFVREDATYPERFAEIYRRLRARPGRPPHARFVCALAAARNGAVVFEATGTIEGEISDTPRGSGGFGYDPIFYYPPYGCTLAEVSSEAKGRVAHRGQAFRQFSAWLRTGSVPDAALEF